MNETYRIYEAESNRKFQIIGVLEERDKGMRTLSVSLCLIASQIISFNYYKIFRNKLNKGSKRLIH